MSRRTAENKEFRGYLEPGFSLPCIFGLAVFHIKNWTINISENLREVSEGRRYV